MKCHGFILSHEGNVRSNNEDNAYINGFFRKNDDLCSWEYESEYVDVMITAVFDGMGGEKEGEVAARIAAESLDDIYKDCYSADKVRKGNVIFSDVVDAYVDDANNRIAKYDPGNNIGTTFAALSFENATFSFYNIGDSRGYLYRDGGLCQMTRDHNLVRRMLKEGILTEEQAEKHPHRNALYQFLGMKEENNVIAPECYKEEMIQACGGDLCLLCTDGLTEMVTDKEICGVLSGRTTLKEKAEKLLEKALQAGGRDNITILLAEAVIM